MKDGVLLWMRFSRTGRWVCAGLAAGLLALWIGQAVHRRQVVQLADGRTFVLQQTTFGKVHRIVAGPLWKQIIAQLPTNIASSLGVSALAFATPTNRLVVWFEESATSTQALPNAMSLRLRVLDSNSLSFVPQFPCVLRATDRGRVTGFELPI